MLRILGKVGGAGRGVLSISAGSAIGQLLGFAAAPLIARLYEPQEYGDFVTITAISMMLGSVLALSLDRCIPLPADDEDAFALLYAAIVGACLLSAAALAVGFVVEGSWSDRPSWYEYWWAVPLAGASLSLVRVFYQLSIRQKRYVSIGAKNALQPAVQGASQIGLGLGSAGTGGLVLGYLLARLVGIVSVLFGSDLLSDASRRGRSLARLRAVVIRYKSFPLLSAPAGLLNTIGLQLPVVLVASAFGRHTAGQFGIANTIVALPVVLIATSIGQVYLSELAEAIRDDPDRARRLFYRTSGRLAMAGALVCAVVLVAAPTLFPLVLGQSWDESGRHAQALGVLAGIRFVAAPLAHTLSVLERNGSQLFVDLVRVAGIAAVFVVAESVGLSGVATVWMLSGSMSLTYLMTWLICKRQIDREVDVRRSEGAAM